MTTTEAVVLIVGLIVIAMAALFLIRQRRSKALRSQFGPEYEHAVQEYGGRSRAETALRKRADRVERFRSAKILQRGGTAFRLNSWTILPAALRMPTAWSTT